LVALKYDIFRSISVSWLHFIHYSALPAVVFNKQDDTISFSSLKMRQDMFIFCIYIEYQLVEFDSQAYLSHRH